MMTLTRELGEVVALLHTQNLLVMTGETNTYRISGQTHAALARIIREQPEARAFYEAVRNRLNSADMARLALLLAIGHRMCEMTAAELAALEAD